MLVQTGYRYRLEPTATQAQRLLEYAGACRWTWNFFLHWRDDAYAAARSVGGALPTGAFSYAWMCRELTHLRRTTPWLALAPASALQQTVRDLAKAYSTFFAGTHRYPRPKTRRNGNGWRGVAPRDVKVDGAWVLLPKLGWMKFRLSRPIPGRVVNATIAPEGPHWFVSFCVQHQVAPGMPSGAPIGIDAGIINSLALSNGEMVHFPVQTKAEARLLGRLQR